MLSRRLGTVFELTPPGGVADIGTDHGYLAAAYARSGRHCPVIASDVAAIPLGRAVAYAQSIGIADRIDFRIGDGLTVLEPGEVRTAVIAGIGGQTVAGMLAAGSGPGTPDLIIQPMSRPDVLRRALANSGFAITAEQLVKENGRIFCIISASPGQMPPMTAAQEAVGLMTGEDPLFGEYLSWVKGFTRKALEGARSGKNGEESAGKLSGLLEQLEAL
ncbi:MAG: SAM-dependent methyltransferase [Oscillospiraceae bacterium]|nr:SAM-dependent methyltransferase [Oscillospiraceae bacterium]